MDDTEDSQSSNTSGTRLRAYKNNRYDADELRRLRETEGVELRKKKRYDQLYKRREVGSEEDAPTVSDDVNMTFLENNVATQNDSAMSIDSTVVKPPKMLINDRVIEALYSSEDNKQMAAMRKCRMILAGESCPPIDEVIQKGLIPRFVEFLHRKDKTSLQFEAAWSLTNIVSGDSKQTRAVIQAGAVPVFVQLLLSLNSDVQWQAVWALANIAGDCAEFRDYVINEGAIPPLLEILMKVNRLSVSRNGIWCLSNLVRGTPPPDFNKVRLLLPVLAVFLFHDDSQLLADDCSALALLAAGPHHQIQAVINSGVCRRLVELLTHSSEMVSAAALRAVGNIALGDAIQTQVLLNCHVLPALISLTTSKQDKIRRDACWILSNITAGNHIQIQMAIEACAIPPLVHVMHTNEFKTRCEAAWAIVNACTAGTREQVQYLVSAGCIEPLCDLLTLADNHLIMVALAGLDSILSKGVQDGQDNLYAIKVEECSGLDKIEALQHHANLDIYKKVTTMIDRYFNSNADSEDMTIAPQIVDNQFCFKS